MLTDNFKNNSDRKQAMGWGDMVVKQLQHGTYITKFETTKGQALQVSRF